MSETFCYLPNKIKTRIPTNTRYFAKLCRRCNLLQLKLHKTLFTSTPFVQNFPNLPHLTLVCRLSEQLWVVPSILFESFQSNVASLLWKLIVDFLSVLCFVLYKQKNNNRKEKKKRSLDSFRATNQLLVYLLHYFSVWVLFSLSFLF